VPDEEKACPFVLPRTVCKREITREEALQYVKEGRTALLEDFTSRLGRPFAAMLFRKENGRHGFDFPPRGARAGAAPAEGAPADAAAPAVAAEAAPAAARPARKSAGRKKAAGQKAVAKKSTRAKGARKAKTGGESES
jgi:hypothetical protein